MPSKRVGKKVTRFEPCACCRPHFKHLEDRIEILTRVARTDVLTGLLNRRAFEERLVEEVERARRGNRRSISLAVFDLDHFKSINDTYGHAVGDAILRKVGVILNERARRSDVVARIGGEEFAFILPSTTAESAVLFLDRIRRVIATQLEVMADGEVVRATASFGVATVREGELPRDALKRADEALYRAKHGGRNRVERA